MSSFTVPVRLGNRTIGVNLAIFDDISLRIRVDAAPTGTRICEATFFFRDTIPTGFKKVLKYSSFSRSIRFS